MAPTSLFAMCALGLVFVVAIGTKTHTRSSYELFVRSLGQYGFGRWIALWVVAVLALGSEVLALSALLISPVVGWSKVVQFAPSVTLLWILSLAIAYGARRNPGNLRCHCFGSDVRTDPVLHIAINIVLSLAALVALVRPDADTGSAGADVLAAGFGVLVGVAAVSLPDLLSILRIGDPAGSGGLGAGL